jgi:hypothetical protein
MKPIRIFILRCSDYDQRITFEEVLPSGTTNQYEADDVYRSFECVSADISYLIGRTSTNSRRSVSDLFRDDYTGDDRRDTISIAKSRRRVLSVVRQVASIKPDESFSVVIGGNDVTPLSSGRSNKRRMVRQKRDVFAETAAAMAEYYAGREAYRKRITKTHGTNASYARGCRCDRCRAASTLYNRRRRKARKKGDFRGYVSGDAAREHLAKIIEAGGSLNVLSRLVNLSHSYLHGVKSGWRTKIRADRASAILSWTPETVAAEKKVQAKPARLHVQSLMDQGATLPQIAQSSGIEAAKLDEVLGGYPYIPTWMARAILSLPPEATSLSGK